LDYFVRKLELADEVPYLPPPLDMLRLSFFGVDIGYFVAIMILVSILDAPSLNSVVVGIN
jgi:hypothetical protein